MILDDAVYERTQSGDAALHGGDAAIPEDYRRILAHLEGGAHIDVIRGSLRQYSDALIDDWLTELLELGFIEPVDSDTTKVLTLEALEPHCVSSYRRPRRVHHPYPPANRAPPNTTRTKLI